MSYNFIQRQSFFFYKSGKEIQEALIKKNKDLNSLLSRKNEKLDEFLNNKEQTRSFMIYSLIQNNDYDEPRFSKAATIKRNVSNRKDSFIDSEKVKEISELCKRIIAIENDISENEIIVKNISPKKKYKLDVDDMIKLEFEMIDADENK